VWDLISLTLNWHSCGSGEVVPSQPKREVQTLLIALELYQRWSVQTEEELSRVFCHRERRKEAAGKETAGAIEGGRRSGCRLKRPPHSTMVRFRTISLDPASEKLWAASRQSETRLEAGCPPIAPYCTTWFTTEDVLLSEPAPKVRSCDYVHTHGFRVVVASWPHHLSNLASTRSESCIARIFCHDSVRLHL
jgi:hypothetical protein